MPLPAGIIAAGAQLAGAGMNAFAQGNANKKNRQFQSDMYDRQFQDNIRFWEMQNAYNTPERQMERFKAAGLNPSLMYGQGNSGNAGAISSPTATKMDYKAPDLSPIANSGAAFINAIYDTRVKNAQIDNLKADTTAKLETAGLTGVSTKLKDLEFRKEGELFDTNVDFRRKQLDELNTRIDLSIREDQRKALMNSVNIKQGLARVAQIYQSMETDKMERKKWKYIIDGIKHDNTVKQLDAFFAQNNIRPQDPFYARMATVVLEQLITEFNESAPKGEKILPKLKESAISKGSSYLGWLKKGGLFQYFK